MTQSNGRALLQKPSVQKEDVVIITQAGHYSNCLALVKQTYEFGGVLAYIYLPGGGVELVNLKPDEFMFTNRRMPRQKPGNSVQTYGTPWEFIRAVETKFKSKLWCDLAATSENAKASRFITPEQDSLSPRTDWSQYLSKDHPSWLNPPFNHIGPWAQKCARYGLMGYKILFLTPLTTANWCVKWIKPYAMILGLNPRMTFEGETQVYIKDLQLGCYGYGKTGFNYWTWKDPIIQKVVSGL